MPRISTDNYDTVASWNGSQDLFIVEQPDGTKVATPAMVKQFIEAGDFTATGEIEDGHGNVLKNMAKSADVDAEIGDISQTGITGDNVAEQLSQLNDEIDAIDIAKADTYISPTRDTAQSFNVGTSTANRMFLLATGYASTHQFGIVFINYSGTSISYKSIASAALTVDAITYNNGIISITFSAAPYTNARLIRLC